MKKETILKVILILIIGSVLLVKPINVFATSTGEPADIDDFWDNSAWEHQGSAGDLKEEEEELERKRQQKQNRNATKREENRRTKREGPKPRAN